MDSAVASASKLAHRSGASMTPSSETRVDSISLRIVVLISCGGSRDQGQPRTDRVGQPPHRLADVLRADHGYLEGGLLSGEQIDADVGAGLPSPIGEELAVLGEGFVAPGLDVQRRQPGQAGV